MMDIMDYYRADLNELNAPDSPTVEELEIELFGTLSLMAVHELTCYGPSSRTVDHRPHLRHSGHSGQ